MATDPALLLAKFSDRAACLSAESNEPWFPETLTYGRGARRYPGLAATGVKVCMSCPVRPQCLQWAITIGTEKQQGTLGGLTVYGRDEARLGKRTPRPRTPKWRGHDDE